MTPSIVAWLLALGPTVSVAGDAGCFTPAAVTARVLSWSESSALPDDASIAITHDADRLHIEVARADGRLMERAFVPPPSKCTDAELVAAVAVALALDATAAQPVPAPAPAVPNPTTPALPPPERPARRDEPAPASPRPRAPISSGPHYSIGLGLGGSVGLGPRPAFEGAVAFRVHWRPVALFAETAVSVRRGAPLGATAGVVDVTRLGVAAGICAPLRRGRVAFGPCAGLAGGAMWGRARGIEGPRGDVARWMAALARTELAVTLTQRVALAAISDVAFGIVRPVVIAATESSPRAVELPTPRVGWRGLLEVRVQWGGVRPATPRRREIVRPE